MPVPILNGRVSGDAEERLPLLEREIGRLRLEVESLRRQATGDSAPGALLGWITMAMAAFGVLLGLIALLRR